MGLSRDEIAQIYTAGTVPIPERFPEVGLITIDPTGIEMKDADNRGLKANPVVQVEHRTSWDQTITYILPLEHVAAILWAPGDKSDEKIDPINGEWVLRDELANDQRQLQSLNPSTGGRGRRGIVYAKEYRGVIAKIVMARAAGEAQLLARIPCCPKP